MSVLIMMISDRNFFNVKAFSIRQNANQISYQFTKESSKKFKIETFTGKEILIAFETLHYSV